VQHVRDLEGDRRHLRLSLDLDVTAADADSSWPSIAWSGERFGVAWLSRGDDVALFRELGADGTPLGEGPTEFQPASWHQEVTDVVWVGGRGIAAVSGSRSLELSTISPEGEVQGFGGVMTDGDADYGHLAAVGEPHNLVYVALRASEARGPKVLVSLGGEPGPANLAEEGVHLGWVSIAWQAPVGRLGVAGERFSAEGVWSVYLARLNLDREWLGELTTVVEGHPIGHPEVAWDGARYVIVWAEITDEDGLDDVSAATVDADGVAGEPVRLSYGSGGHHRPDLAVSEHGSAVVWRDTESGPDDPGGISLLVGPLFCD